MSAASAFTEVMPVPLQSSWSTCLRWYQFHCSHHDQPVWICINLLLQQLRRRRVIDSFSPNVARAPALFCDSTRDILLNLTLNLTLTPTLTLAIFQASVVPTPNHIMATLLHVTITWLSRDYRRIVRSPIILVEVGCSQLQSQWHST